MSISMHLTLTTPQRVIGMLLPAEIESYQYAPYLDDPAAPGHFGVGRDYHHAVLFGIIHHELVFLESGFFVEKLLYAVRLVSHHIDIIIHPVVHLIHQNLHGMNIRMPPV